ncbi:unnamed protein product [Lymnaea stagnalis]|uniref:Major facilitator superfamily (MFS) profile domain-containing protein n=1 Tax=Lymnaea stagnalis TaxID=6523 RepID=A0AAV2HBF9_LYMST
MADERTQLVTSGSSFRHPNYKKHRKGDKQRKDYDDVNEVSLLCSYRLGVIICCTFSMTITFAAQASMSSAMVCMIEDPLPALQVDNSSNWTALDAVFTYTNLTSSNVTDDKWKFNWDKTTQGWALSSFFVGYYVSQLPSGIAAARYGAKKVVVIGLILTSVFQLLTVPAAYYGAGWLYADRILVGIIDGFLYAPTFALVGQWTPRHETSLLFGIVGMGMELGDMCAFGVSLFSCEIPIQGGWPFVFYTLSGIGLLIAAAFIIFVSDSPFENTLMSDKEVKFIAQSIPKVEEKSAAALTSIPVKEILKSAPVWAIVVSQIGSDWMYYFIVTVSPTYLKDVIRLSSLEINIISGLPFLGIIPTIYLSGYLSDRVVTRGVVSNTTVRKVNDGFCKLIPAGILIAMGFLPEGSVGGAFGLNFVGAMALGFAYVSWMANPVDLAPAYTGFIVGVCEVGAVWVGIVVPIVVETITDDKSREKWQLAFYISAGLQVFCYAFYLMFASGELQPWAFSSYKHAYQGLGNEEVDGLLKNKMTPAGSNETVDSVSDAKRRAKDEESQRLIMSLSLSLGGFRGTLSYEEEVQAEQERRRKEYAEGPTLVYYGSAQTDGKLESGFAETNLRTHNECKTLVSVGVQVYASDMNTPSPETSGDYTQSRPRGLRHLPPVEHGRGDLAVVSTPLLTSSHLNSSSSPQHNEGKIKAIASDLISSFKASTSLEKSLENSQNTSSIMEPTDEISESVDLGRHLETHAIKTDGVSLWEEINQADAASGLLKQKEKSEVHSKKPSFFRRLFRSGRSRSNPDLAEEESAADEVDGGDVILFEGSPWATKSFESATSKRKTSVKGKKVDKRPLNKEDEQSLMTHRQDGLKNNNF